MAGWGIMDKLESYKKNIKRAGDKFLNDIFRPYRDVSFFDGRKNLLQGKDCLKIMNTIGITSDIIYLLAIANGLDGIDEIGFNELHEEQKRQMKGSKQCQK